MKAFRISLAFIVAASLASLASAQSDTKLESLKLVQRDLRRAANEMQPCLPIYQGNCGQAKEAVRQARVIVNAAVAALEPAPAAKPAAKEPAPTEKAAAKKTAPAKGLAEQKPVAKQEIPAKADEPKLSEDQKIAESQARLRKGLEAIQLALKDLKEAASALPEDQASKVEKLIQTAAEAATKAIALHANQG